jgi:flagellar M-ring protein FliF
LNDSSIGSGVFAMSDFWKALSRAARVGLVVGVVTIVLLLAGATWWLLHTDYQVLFSDLKPQDAGAMTAELERLKVPYQVADNGTAILVDKAVVHTTRIKLMGKELPLHGAVGLELFNNTDFGMTEFAQKINYQRAVQGELTRTILSLAEVRDVRVHLALPEQGLFKQATSKAKASISLTLRQGQVLRPEQVTGITRLVAAAVPGMTPQDVTIVDNQGVTLSRPSGEGELEASSARLDFKRETENYLSRKAGLVLDRMFGPGQAIVSVDVVLNLDQVKLTTEEVIPAQVSRKNGQAPTGVVVRERESMREMPPSAESKNETESSLPARRSAGSTQREVEYQVGRRVEQVVSQPGSIRRIQAVALVRKPLDSVQEEQLKKMVAAAVGASLERGDTVVIQTFSGSAVVAGAPTPVWDAYGASPLSAQKPDESGGVEKGASQDGPPAKSARSQEFITVLLALLLLTVLLGLYLIYGRKGVGAKISRESAPAASLTEQQRQVALQRVQAWMRQPRSGGATELADQPTGGAL